jgi:anti-sigma regulatory factor (Ser/Thr protein kinase)
MARRTTTEQAGVRRSAPLQIPAREAEVSHARRHVRSWFESIDDMPADVVDDLVLMTSELLTNAVEHGSGDTVELVLTDDGRASTISMTSFADDEAFTTVGDGSAWTIADAMSRSGRGLGIVRALADDVAVRRERDRLTVTAKRSR